VGSPRDPARPGRQLVLSRGFPRPCRTSPEELTRPFVEAA
jgi:hypothetical protein